MAISFFPRIIKFFELFKKQNNILLESSSLLSDLFGDYTNISEKCGKIIKNELAGNDISKEIAKSLSLTFITPIDREDIFAINMAQENVLNSIRAIATRIGLYNFENIRPGALDLVQKMKTILEEISVMLGTLSTRKDVEQSTKKVKEIKLEADMMLLVSLGEIYENPAENTKELLNLIKWAHIYDRIEEALASTEFLANTIEGISLKNA
ncbi:MAG: DUF47 family protein [Bacteroidetes bacterium]|nr:DUF47 family protein [Bacteroidota bacterium]